MAGSAVRSDLRSSSTVLTMIRHDTTTLTRRKRKVFGATTHDRRFWPRQFVPRICSSASVSAHVLLVFMSIVAIGVTFLVSASFGWVFGIHGRMDLGLIPGQWESERVDVRVSWLHDYDGL